jgi:hypothetical protein
MWTSPGNGPTSRYQYRQRLPTTPPPKAGQNWRAAAPEHERTNQPPRSGHIPTRDSSCALFQFHRRMGGDASGDLVIDAFVGELL